MNAGQAGQLNPTGPNAQHVIATYAEHNAIVLDGELKSTPYIDYTDPHPLARHRRQRADHGAERDAAAAATALVLQSGSLPYSFQQLATDRGLGDARQELAPPGDPRGDRRACSSSRSSCSCCTASSVSSRSLGLAIYALLYYAAILLFNVTLTLPGFAGLILTIGVAADANVVVFERIKEEVRAGRSVRSAISAGYGKGFHTILDANVVTMITAIVIFLIAVADVKGFALMLLIGTVISLLTAVAATRAMLGLLSGFKWFDNPRFMGARGPADGEVAADRLHREAQAVVRDLGRHHPRRPRLARRPGPQPRDRLQGRLAVHVPDAPAVLDRGSVQAFMASRASPTRSCRARAAPSTATSRTWQVRTKTLDRREQSNLEQALQDRSRRHSAGGVESVSGTFGHQIAVDAIYGIIVSLLLITIFIAIRFDLKFAIPVILAMVHDILITIGVYSLVGKEVTVDTVAAVLTVLGYSIYDTIIIFDRIRENIPLMRRSPFATIANVSLWETIRRSLATTFITLLPIICLLILGGATLKDFAFALIVGVISGAYSSIFIAAPLLTMWKEREPEYARRKAPGRGRRDCPRTATVAAATSSSTPARLSLASEAALAAEPTPELVDVATATPSEPAGARRGARSGGSGGARGRMAGRGSNRLLLDAFEELLAELPSRVRGSRDAVLGEALSVLRGIADELNLVTRDDLDELELRVAQLEHRLRLLEQADASRPSRSNGTPRAGKRGFRLAPCLVVFGSSGWDAALVRSRAAEADASAVPACC